MLVYNYIEFITKAITVLKTYYRKNILSLSTSITTNNIIQKADKGNTAVIIDQANYVIEMEHW